MKVKLPLSALSAYPGSSRPQSGAPQSSWGILFHEDLERAQERLNAAVAQAETAGKGKQARASMEQELDSLSNRIHFLEHRLKARVIGEDVKATTAELQEKKLRFEFLERELGLVEDAAREVLELENRLRILRHLAADGQPEKLTDEDIAASLKWLELFLVQCDRESCITYSVQTAEGLQRYSGRFPGGAQVRFEKAKAREVKRTFSAERSRRIFLRHFPGLSERWEEFRLRQVAFRARLAELVPEALELTRIEQQLLNESEILHGHGLASGQSVPYQWRNRVIGTGAPNRIGSELHALEEAR